MNISTATLRFSLIPQRFQTCTGSELTIAIAQGKEETPALKNTIEATKKLREGINAIQS